MAQTARKRYNRHSIFSRTRHARRFIAWLTGENTRLGATATPDDVVATANVFATGILTLTGNATKGDLALGCLDYTGNAVNGEIVTIGSNVYTYKTAITEAEGDVLIGVDQQASLENLTAAINFGVGKGVVYSNSTKPHPDVEATSTPDSIEVCAKVVGVAGNSIITTDTLTNASWVDPTLLFGLDPDTVTVGDETYTFVDPLLNIIEGQSQSNKVLVGSTASNSLDNLIAAINGGSGLGATYSEATTKNLKASAAAGAGDTIDLTSLVPGTDGNNVVTVSSMFEGSFGAATLENGVRSILTAASNGISNAEGPYHFTTTDTLPAGLDLATDYWVTVIDANTFAVSRQRAGVDNVITDTGTGTHTITKASDNHDIYALNKLHKAETIADASDIDDLA